MWNLLSLISEVITPLIMIFVPNYSLKITRGNKLALFASLLFMQIKSVYGTLVFDPEV